MKRNSPDDKDAQRIAQIIFSQDIGGNINSFDEFENRYIRYMAGSSNPSIINHDELIRKAYSQFTKIIGKIDKSRDAVFRKAGGKDLAKDTKTNAKIITESEDRYIKLGAQNADLKGLDTKIYDQSIVLKKFHEKYNKYGKVKGALVFAREVTFKRGSKEITRLRDIKGRFISRMGDKKK